MMQFYNKTDFSYKLGPDIFVTPILASGGTVSINFPVGSNWIYLFDKTKTYTGGSSTTETFPINEFPVYIREGASVGDVLRKVL
jgi:alpha-glucosidase (family GH31 glycosyl hydrolase)